MAKRDVSRPLARQPAEEDQVTPSIQREALRLFAAQGYEDTTVEQIADAADISTSTFYRYFPTNEDVVLDDEYDPIVEDVIISRDRDEPLVTTIRAAVAALATAVAADRDEALERLKLRATVPALQARQGSEGRKTLEFFIGLFSARSCRPAKRFGGCEAGARGTAAPRRGRGTRP